MATVPFLDVGATYRELQEELDAAVHGVLSGGWYILGNEVSAFEQEFAEYCGTTHCVGASNGLDALHLLLRALGVGPGDEVIVPANTFIATWLAVTQVGATPVPVDPDPRTCNITVDAVRAAITPRTRVLLPVHLYGQPADMAPLVEVAREHGLRVVEDAAQAHGARYRGSRAGSLADAAAWSFYPGKNLGAFGDAGAVTTDDEDLAERVRLLGNYGSRRKYVHELAGYNARLDELQAAVLRVKLRHLDAWNARRGAVAAEYTTGFAGTGLVLPVVSEWAEPSWHLYVVQAEHRDELARRLDDAGIDTGIHYPRPPHLQEAYAGEGGASARLPLSEQLARRVLSLPIGPHLRDVDVERVIRAVVDATRA